MHATFPQPLTPLIVVDLRSIEEAPSDPEFSKFAERFVVEGTESTHDGSSGKRSAYARNHCSAIRPADKNKNASGQYEYYSEQEDY